MKMQYLALLRGINVGGNSLIKMADLKAALEANGFAEVRTYIQSGNVLFVSEETDVDVLSKRIQASIERHCRLAIGVVVLSKDQWQHIIEHAPDWWGKDATWKHNIIVMLRPFDMKQVVTAIGVLKPDIEAMEPGEGILYQSLSFKQFGRTTGGKLASNPVYKQMTIRNYNTATKLLALLNERS